MSIKYFSHRGTEDTEKTELAKNRLFTNAKISCILLEVGEPDIFMDKGFGGYEN